MQISSRRVILIVNWLIQGKRLTVAEVHDKFKDKGWHVSKRMLQRDFSIIMDEISIVERIKT